MKSIFHATLLTLTALTFNSVANDLEPWMLKKGDLIFSEDFSKPLNADDWKPLKGTWAVEAGALKGLELESDHHAAVIRKDASLKNVIIQFDFKFNGCSGFSLSLNHDGGHNSRVVFAPDGFMLKKDLNKKDPVDFTAIFGEYASSFDDGKWHTMIVEYHDREMMARIDDTAYIIGAHDFLNQERINLGFPVSGNSALFDNVKVWQGTLREDWPEKRNTLIKTQQQRPDIVHKDPKTNWQVAESNVRQELMQHDPEFQALVQKRAAIDTKLKQTYPKAFRKNSKGANEKKRLMKEDPEFKKLSKDLTLARRDEREYMHKKSPKLAALFIDMNEARKKQAGSLR